MGGGKRPRDARGDTAFGNGVTFPLPATPHVALTTARHPSRQPHSLPATLAALPTTAFRTRWIEQANKVPLAKNSAEWP